MLSDQEAREIERRQSKRHENCNCETDIDCLLADRLARIERERRMREALKEANELIDDATDYGEHGCKCAVKCGKDCDCGYEHFITMCYCWLSDTKSDLLAEFGKEGK